MKGTVERGRNEGTGRNGLNGRAGRAGRGVGKSAGALVFFAAGLLAVLGSCAKGPADAGTAARAAADTVKVRQVVVGTGNAMKDFCFLDEKGNLVGIEIDILTAVDELLPQYEFSFESAEFRSILVGVDAGKYDIAAHYYARNAEREAKYLYGKVPYLHYSYQITVKAGRTDIQSVKDLEGKVVSASPGSNASYFLETYNQTQAATPIELSYGSLDTETQIRGLEEGRYDAYINTVRGIDDIRKTYNNRIEGVGPELLPGYTFYIFAPGDTVLRDDVDGALTALRENGTLRELSLKWLNRDYSFLVPELEL
jgi:L-cystine transport system substrate-binding protein